MNQIWEPVLVLWSKAGDSRSLMWKLNRHGECGRKKNGVMVQLSDDGAVVNGQLYNGTVRALSIVEGENKCRYHNTLRRKAVAPLRYSKRQLAPWIMPTNMRELEKLAWAAGRTAFYLTDKRGNKDQKRGTPNTSHPEWNGQHPPEWQDRKVKNEI